MKRLNIGIIGAGRIGRVHAEDLAFRIPEAVPAVIADVNEEWVTPVDTQLEALGVSVMRTVKQDFELEERAKQMAKLREEIEQTKAELARAHADRKAKLQARINKLNAQLQAQVEQAKNRSEQVKTETEAKVRALQKRAEDARADVKAKLNEQVTRVRQEYEESDAKLSHMLAKRLRGGAAARREKEQAQRSKKTSG